MTAPTCEDAEIYAKRKENLRFFLDHLPTHPCCERPNINLCTVCFKINFDVARDCDVYKLHNEGIIAGDPKETIHVELARSIDLARDRGEEEVPISEELEKEFPLFEFVAPTIKTPVFEVEAEEETVVEEEPAPKPKKKVEAAKVTPKKKVKAVKKLAKPKEAPKPLPKEEPKITLFGKLESTLRGSYIRPYAPDKDTALLEEAALCMWRAIPDDNKVSDSPIIDMWTEFYESLEGVEPRFWKFIDRYLGKGPEHTKGAPVFVFNDKWAGVLSISKEKGIRIYMDHERSTVSERMEVLDHFIDAASTLRKKAIAKGEDMKAKTNSRANWADLISGLKAKEAGGGEVKEVGTLAMGGEAPPAPVIKKVKRVAKAPEPGPEPPKAVAKKVKRVAKAPEPVPEPEMGPPAPGDALSQKAPAPPPKPGGGVPPLFATLGGKLETKKKDKDE